MMTKTIHKRVANWLGTPTRIINQLFVSCWSYLTFPIAKFHSSAAKDYFTNLYKSQPDPLIFDGKDTRYLEQVGIVYDTSSLVGETVLDLGCGNGSLYDWLSSKQIVLREYIGIDFAHFDKKLDANASILNKDVNNFQIDETNANVVFAVNVLCYLDDSPLSYIFQSEKKNIKLIIIEPTPGLFWDAHFDGVKLFYRNRQYLINILESNGWRLQNSSIDYWFKFLRMYFFPLSYCLFFVKE